MSVKSLSLFKYKSDAYLFRGRRIAAPMGMKSMKISAVVYVGRLASLCRCRESSAMMAASFACAARSGWQRTISTVSIVSSSIFLACEGRAGGRAKRRAKRTECRHCGVRGCWFSKYIAEQYRCAPTSRHHGRCAASVAREFSLTSSSSSSSSSSLPALPLVRGAFQTYQSPQRTRLASTTTKPFLS